MGIFALGIGFAAAADKEAKTTAYIAQMTGVTWAGCKKYVRGALEKKFKATNIVITNGDKPKTQKVTFTCDKGDINKKIAADSMGAAKNRFIVTAIKKKGWKANLVLLRVTGLRGII